tara:strand:- start:665 stop:889 length:225 start_codon:yes stop_codon:yes gene_type:complete
MTEFEHYGESLTTHPDYLLMKQMHEENLWYEQLETTKKCSKFVTLVSENEENLIGRQEVKENEKNILRGTLGFV